MLDPLPRIVLVPGLGLYGLGRSAKDARIAADLAEAAIATITDAEAIGRFQSITEADMFDTEYWPIEQAKLGKAKEMPLAGQVAVVTGAGGAIGAATAGRSPRPAPKSRCWISTLPPPQKQAAGHRRERARRSPATSPAAHRSSAAFDQVVEAFGGVDIVVSNAGAAWQGRIGEVDEAMLRKSFELNFFGHQRVAQAAVKIMLAQGTGGCLLFNVSKQAVNPGPNFGPYGLPKAATMLLVRQYAVDYGADGIRSNGVNADRIRSGLLTDDFIKERSKARGVSEKDYMSGNLLGREVTAEDVAQAFLHQALELKTTGDVTTVDGGNIAAALAIAENYRSRFRSLSAAGRAPRFLRQPMEASMSARLAELDTAPQTIEPVVNYIVNDGTKVINYTGGPGSTETKNGGTPDPHKVVMHNGRPHLDEFKLDVRRLPLRPPRHQGAELLRRGRDQARLLSGDGGADQSRERRQARRRVRSHAAHRRRCAPREAENPRGRCAAPTTTTPNGPARSA